MRKQELPEPRKTLFVDSGDADIYCELFGIESNRTMVLLHGNGEDLHYFDPQISCFSSNYNIVAIDSRGHGRSTRGTKSLDFSTMTKDVLNVLNTLQIDKAHLLGFSDGANLALYLALSAPDRFFSIILTGANYRPEGLLPSVRASIYLTYAGLIFKSFFSKKYILKKEICELMVYHPNLTITEISRINIPTLVMTGEHDMVSQTHNDEISRAVSGSERIIVPNGDHFLSSKMPETFNRIIGDFLSRVDNDSGVLTGN
ncbi:MAG: alpha/beta hydrolase [Candidatus Azobacteroides sp.]|nr:alpha/beta hydrolase [Candidatus Azobacteroides sp.]